MTDEYLQQGGLWLSSLPLISCPSHIFMSFYRTLATIATLPIKPFLQKDLILRAICFARHLVRMVTCRLSKLGFVFRIH
jgi:hypothetical protein